MQQTYLEGFEQEGLVEFRKGPADPTAVGEPRVHKSGSTTITEQDFHAGFSGQPGELAAFGIRERTI